MLGAWLHAYYRSAVAERDAEGVANVGLTVPVCNLLAYLLGPIALTQPHWVAVSLTVTAVRLAKPLPAISSKPQGSLTRSGT